MAAVVIAIARAPFQRKSILTSRAVFVYQLPRIGVLNGNGGSTGCVRRGREEYAIILSFFFIHLWFLSRYRPVFTLSASFNALSIGNGIWPLSFAITYSALHIRH